MGRGAAGQLGGSRAAGGVQGSWGAQGLEASGSPGRESPITDEDTWAQRRLEPQSVSSHAEQPPHRL